MFHVFTHTHTHVTSMPRVNKQISFLATISSSVSVSVPFKKSVSREFLFFVMELHILFKGSKSKTSVLVRGDFISFSGPPFFAEKRVVFRRQL